MIIIFVKYTEQIKTGFFARFYNIVPAILLCYFLPSLLNTFKIVDTGDATLYNSMISYFLPVCIVYFTLSINLKAVKLLGSKAVIMFLTGSVGVMIGGPLAILICKPLMADLFQQYPDLWKGLSTIAGSWIGGAANQAAMKEMNHVDETVFSAMITLDVIVAYIWMALLLWLTKSASTIDRKLGVNDHVVTNLLNSKIEAKSTDEKGINQSLKWPLLIGTGFIITGVSHFMADILAPYIGLNYPELATFNFNNKFFWVIILSTTISLFLSGTRVRQIEKYGSVDIAGLLLYVIIATLGLKMDITAIFKMPELLLLCLVWIMFHILFMFLVAKIIKAPFFLVAVGSQANIGGPASAPVVAAAFAPQLAPFGVILAVLGYAVGTYGAYICGLLMKFVSNV
ncbi:DUF819 family protein [Polluticaenibacter yanchengensis]|uniref:DUF819 family protein n=1 Tax=Polluticaenibacter yanchengensis TaxID=3014562 RepID=A0ABT4UG39_9BACT|nr:DUF819 family protein [Chitinophagaceae bacterium LY-5]